MKAFLMFFSPVYILLVIVYGFVTGSFLTSFIAVSSSSLVALILVAWCKFCVDRWG